MYTPTPSGFGNTSVQRIQRAMQQRAVAPKPVAATPVTPTPTAAPIPMPAPVAAAPVTPSPEVVKADPKPTVTPTTAVAPIPVAPITTGNGTVQGTPTNPANPLTAQTLSVAPTVDRFKIAEDRYNAGEPAYQATLRSAQQKAFGAGRGVSGALRTSLGDAASAREGQRVNFLSDALSGTIDDAYKNLGIAQQQQGFQQGQQDRAFDQDYRTRQLEEALTSGAFGRALQQAQFGYGNDPSQIGLTLSQIFGNQANAAGDAAAGLFSQQGRNAGTSSSGIPAWLQALMPRGASPQSAGQIENEVNSP